MLRISLFLILQKIKNRVKVHPKQQNKVENKIIVRPPSSIVLKEDKNIVKHNSFDYKRGC